GPGRLGARPGGGGGAAQDRGEGGRPRPCGRGCERALRPGAAQEVTGRRPGRNPGDDEDPGTVAGVFVRRMRSLRLCPTDWSPAARGLAARRSDCARSTDLLPLAGSQHVDQSAISMRPRWYAFARRRGTEAVRPRTVTCTRSALLAFHCERRERVRARDILNLG